MKIRAIIFTIFYADFVKSLLRNPEICYIKEAKKVTGGYGYEVFEYF